MAGMTTSLIKEVSTTREAGADAGAAAAVFAITMVSSFEPVTTRKRRSKDATLPLLSEEVTSPYCSETDTHSTSSQDDFP